MRKVFVASLLAAASLVLSLEGGAANGDATFRLTNLLDLGKKGANKWPLPTEVPPIKQGHWDFRQLPGCKVPLSFLTVNGEGGDVLPLGPLGAALARADVRQHVAAVVGSWNAVEPSVLDIDLMNDAGATWPAAPAEPFGLDSANVLLFSRRGAPNEPGENVPHEPGKSFRRKSVQEETVDSDVALHQPTIRWTLDPAAHDRTARPAVLDLQTILIHELGHFVGLGHTTEDPNEKGPAFVDPVMHFQVPPAAKRSLHASDKAGFSFLYTPDLGDAPKPYDPQTQVRDGPSGQKLNGVDLLKPADGAVHLLGHPPFEFEKLGAAEVSGECDPRQVDADNDDGVEISGDLRFGGVLEITVKVRVHKGADGKGDGRYDKKNKAVKHPAAFLNAWADWNNDGKWFHGAEKIIGTNVGADSTEPHGTQAFTQDVDAKYKVKIPGRASLKKGIWFRFRLDYGEDAGKKKEKWSSPDLNGPDGLAAFGEVEDWFKPPESPGKSSLPNHLERSGLVRYTIDVPASPELRRPASAAIADELPAAAEFAGALHCPPGDCGYDDATRTVRWDGTLAPGERATLSFDVAIEAEAVCATSEPPVLTLGEVEEPVALVVNESHVFDGLDQHLVAATTTVACSAVHQVLVLKEGTGTGLVVSDPPGIQCGLVCAAGFPRGEIALHGHPDPGSRLVGWGGDCTGVVTALDVVVGSDPCVLLVDGAKLAVAFFEADGIPAD